MLSKANSKFSKIHKINVTENSYILSPEMSILGGGLPNYNFENSDGLSRRKGQDNILNLVPKGSTPVAVFPPFAMDRIGK